MKRITRIEIENFRAFFARYTIELPGGENLLVYGENGSGKSSLFKGLNNYLSSSRDAAFGFVRNHYRPAVDNGEIKITFSDVTPAFVPIAGTDQVLHFGNAASTHRINFVMDAELVKGFLGYRSLLDVYFNDEPKPNLFDLIVLNVLGNHLNGARTYRFGEKWKELQRDLIEKSYNSRTWVHRNALAELPNYYAELLSSLKNIFRYLNTVLLKTYFSELNIELRFELQPLTFNYGRAKWEWNTTADLRLRVMQNGSFVQDDYNDFLNEARLSAFAICIYLAALKTNPELIDYRILFFDDVFVGLDTSNRFPILKIIRNEFREHQVFVTTYDRHLFELAKRQFELETPGKWKTVEFYVSHDTIGTQKYEAPIVVTGDTHLEKGTKYLDNRERPDYPASSNYFRKALEETIQDYVPKYELTDAESTQIPDHKLNKLVFVTKNFLNKTGNSEEHINQIAGILTALLHPLSHHEIKAPIYKRELQIAQNAIPKLKLQLVGIDHVTNIKCMLDFKKHLRLTFTVNATTARVEYYELVTEENLLKKINGAASPILSTCRCRAVKITELNAGVIVGTFHPVKDDIAFHYTSLENAHNTIYAFLVAQNGAFPRQPNYMDSIEFHSGVTWEPINSILPW